MQNSKNKKLQSNLKWLGWIAGLASKFLPGNMKIVAVALSTVAGGAVTLLDQCDRETIKTSPPAFPSPTPAITSSPTPTPTKPPLPELRSLTKVKAGEQFMVELCNVGNVYEVSLYADNYRLGYMGFGTPCMKLSINLSGKGKRLLAARGSNLIAQTIVVVE